MKTILIFICILSFLILIILFLLIKNNRNKNINNFDHSIGNVTNIISFIGVLLAVLALVISIWGLMLQIRTPKLQIGIFTIHEVSWEEENGERKLCLSYDKDSHIDFAMSMPSVWHLHIINEGNQFAENVKIKITFSEFGFTSEPNYFTLANVNYGLGSYAVIEHIFNDEIQPGESIEVPDIPFRNAELYANCPENTNMKIQIYENNSLVLEKNFLIEFVENEMLENKCALEIYESDEKKIVRKLNKYYFENYGYNDYIFESDIELGSISLYSTELVFSLEDYENVYRHYLNLTNVYNPSMATIYSKLAVFYGRLYYYGLSKEIPGLDIEQAIENDMITQRKY